MLEENEWEHPGLRHYVTKPLLRRLFDNQSGTAVHFVGYLCSTTHSQPANA